jgi:hypothetical protein
MIINGGYQWYIAKTFCVLGVFSGQIFDLKKNDYL